MNNIKNTIIYLLPFILIIFSTIFIIYDGNITNNILPSKPDNSSQNIKQFDVTDNYNNKVYCVNLNTDNLIEVGSLKQLFLHLLEGSIDSDTYDPKNFKYYSKDGLIYKITYTINNDTIIECKLNRDKYKITINKIKE